MSYATLLTELNEGIFTITINRPDKLNALNQTVLAELENVVEEVYQNKTIRSAIITGAGTKAFVAGADISEFTGLSNVGGKTLATKGQELFFKIENAPKPFVACVNGFALGGGCELAMACHFRIASSTAKFGQPEVNLGIIPGYGGTQRLTQLIGKGRAFELLLSGNMIDAAMALQYGLVNHVTEPEALLSKAKEILSVINSKSPAAVAKCITTVNAAWQENVNGYEVEAEQFAQCFGTSDMHEGVAAFMEKRKPVFFK
jgi:enoyl-CoA hydratase